MNITPSNLPPIRPSSPKGKEKVNPKKSHFPKEKKNPVSSRMEKIISEADGALEKKIPPGLKPKQIDTISKGNLGNPSALQIEGDTTQPSLSWLSPALKEKIQRMELELIKNKQQDTAQATQSPGPIFSAEPLGNSLNPVGILKKPIYLQKSSLNTAEYPSFPMVSNVLKNAVINATGSRIRKAHKQKELINLNNEFKRIYDNEGLNPKEKFEMANATFNDFKKKQFCRRER